MRSLYLLLAIICLCVLGCDSVTEETVSSEDLTWEKYILHTKWSTFIGDPPRNWPPPFSLAVDKSRNVYLVMGDSVYKFASDGMLLREWAVRPGCAASGIAIDESGHIYVGDWVGNGIS